MDVIDRLHAAVKASGIPKKTIAHRIGITSFRLSRLLNNHLESPSIRTIEDILREIGLSMPALYGGKGSASEAQVKKSRDGLRALGEFVDLYDPAVQRDPPRSLAAPRLPKSSPPHVAKPFRAVAMANAILFDDDELKEVKIPRSLWNRGAKWAAQAVGDSMKAAGIDDGDIVFFRRTRNVRAARNQIVVCRVGTSVYIKRLRAVGDQIHLVSENDDVEYPTVVVKPDDDVEQYGIVILPSR